jgi:hypothetical protein
VSRSDDSDVHDAFRFVDRLKSTRPTFEIVMCPAPLAGRIAS